MSTRSNADPSRANSLSRRKFIQAAGAAASLALVSPGHAAALPFPLDEAPALQPHLLPSADEVWNGLTWMAKLGPKYTGNDAHRTFVEYLAKNLQATGIDVQRDNYTLTRWTATKWGLKLAPSGGAAVSVPATSYYPYSGTTSAEGVTGELVQIPNTTKPLPAANGFGGALFAAPGDLTGKVVFIEASGIAPPWNEWYKPWGFYPEGVTFTNQISGLWGILTPLLTDLKKAGAVGIILGWTNVSDGQAQHQYTPFSKPFQDIPAIWVGKESTAKLRAAAGKGAKATVILEAESVPNVSTDTLYGALPGMSSDSILIVNSHTDGTNATEENGGLGILALAKYFSKLPKESRKRDIVFVLTTGHFAAPQVPSIRGWVTKHPDLIKKAAGSVTVEHLGCREWLDNDAGEYAPTGKQELSFAISDFEGAGAVMLESAKGGGDKRLAAVKGRYFGEGGALSRAGVPNIGFIPLPSYLVADPANGCIEKLDKALVHAQIENLARAIHKLDGMSAEEIKGSSSANSGS